VAWIFWYLVFCASWGGLPPPQEITAPFFLLFESRIIVYPLEVFPAAPPRFPYSFDFSVFSLTFGGRRLIVFRQGFGFWNAPPTGSTSFPSYLARPFLGSGQFEAVCKFARRLSFVFPFPPFSLCPHEIGFQ